MNYQGTLGRVYQEWLYANSSSWCSLEATRFYFYFIYILFYIFYFIYLHCFVFQIQFLMIPCSFVLRHNKFVIIGAICARLYWDYLSPELLGAFYTKWDRLCLSYLGVIFPPVWDHLCPRFFRVIFFFVWTLVKIDIRLTL